MRHPAKIVLAASLLALCPVSPVQAAEGGGWQWVNAPYLWAASTSVDLHEDPPISGESSFSDVVSKLDMAFQLHVEGQGERFGVFGDVTYLDVSDEQDSGAAGLATEMSMNMTVIEIAGVWNVDPARYEGLNLFAGMRHTISDADVEFIPDNPALPTLRIGTDQSYTDAMVGAYYMAKLSDKWGMMLRADGSWGDTEGAINLGALLTRKFSRGSLVFGYRYMDTDLGENGREINTTMGGPLVAFAFGL